MSKTLVGCLALLIGGCATQAELAAPRGDAMAIANAERSRCFDVAMLSDAYQVIKGKIPEPGSSSVPFAIKADDQRPTVAQAAALMQFHSDLEPCRQRYLSDTIAINPLYGPAMTRYMAARDTEYLKLAKR